MPPEYKQNIRQDLVWISLSLSLLNKATGVTGQLENLRQLWK